MITVAVCDDQKADLDKIKHLVENALVLEQAGANNIILYNDSSSLMDDIRNNKKIDLLYLDIILPSGSGFTVADEIRRINDSIKIIFVSNYNDLVYQSLFYQPFLFIRKRMLEYEIDGSIRYFLKYQAKHFPICKFKVHGHALSVNSKDILYMTSNLHSLTVCLKDTSFTCRDSITNRQKELHNYGFVQSHISCLVNLRYVEKIRKNEIIMQNGDSLALSRGKQKQVEEAYLLYLREPF